MHDRHRDNHDLRSSDIPPRGSPWSAIEPFARSFAGYQYHGSLDACAEIANARRCETLTDLRTCLFFEQRRYNHFGWPPAGEELEYIFDLLDGIRGMVESDRLE